MTTFPKLALLAIISRAYLLKSVGAFVISNETSRLQVLASQQQHHQHILKKNKSTSTNISKNTSATSLMAEKRSGNPFQSFLGDVASSIVGGVSGAGNTSGNTNTKELDDKLSNKNTIPTLSTWEEIKTKLESIQTNEEKAFRTNVAKGIGKASPLNKIRLFDESNKEEDICVTLYRDSASWCPYCQKVWLTLEEKRIPYRIEKINMRCYGEKPQSFMRLQPNGAIPVAVIDGTVYNQSNDIMYALEQTFPDHKKLVPPPNDEKLRIKANSLLRLERTLFSAWMSWLTGSDRSKGSFINILKEVEDELSAMKGGDFFLGKDVTIVDFMFTPFLERTVASLLFFKGYQIRVAPGVDTEFKAINKWFDAMETLESYQLTKSDYYTHCWDLPPQLGGCTYEKGGERYEKVINGERTLDGSRGSWELPLEAHNCGVEPDWTWCGDEDAAKREAVERLSFNSANIAAFAARGAGKKGFPPYSAALSDPNATPSEGVKGSVDACLRVISAAMIGNDEDSANATMKEVATTILQDGGKDQVDDVVASLAYLRDRVGVPRDMRLPAARQLRARLNWAIEKMIS